MDYYNNQGFTNPNIQQSSPYSTPYQSPNIQMPFYQQPLLRRDDNRFVWIQGKEGAMAYPIGPNTTLIFLDDQQPYVYKKKTDQEGKTIEFKVFKLVEELPANTQQTIQQVPTPEYVTKEEFNKLSDEIRALTESMNKRSYNKPSYKGGKNNG